jgi:hypothetical protein
MANNTPTLQMPSSNTWPLKQSPADIAAAQDAVCAFHTCPAVSQLHLVAALGAGRLLP